MQFSVLAENQYFQRGSPVYTDGTEGKIQNHGTNGNRLTDTK